MEWRGQQHAREAVESTASSATSTIQLHHHLQAGSDEEEDGRASYRIDQGELMIKASTKELSFPIDYKS